MAIPHAYPGMPVDLRAREETLSETRTTALVKNDTFEAIRLVARKGHEICHNHEVEGLIAFTADGDTDGPGRRGAPFGRRTGDSAVLVTKVLPANPQSP